MFETKSVIDQLRHKIKICLVWR